MIRLPLIIALGIFASCHTPSKSPVENEVSTQMPYHPADVVTDSLKDEYSMLVFRNDSMQSKIKDGYGYRLIKNSKVLIEQPVIPAIQGLIPFHTEAEAQAAARVALLKLRNGIFPPALSVQELDSLGINYSVSRSR